MGKRTRRIAQNLRDIEWITSLCQNLSKYLSEDWRKRLVAVLVFAMSQVIDRLGMFAAVPFMDLALLFTVIACTVAVVFPWGFLKRRKECSESEPDVQKKESPVEPLLTRPNLTIGEVKLPDGTTLKDIHGDAPIIKEQDQPTAIAVPSVIPIRYGNEGLLEGLLLTNAGEKPVRDITVDSIQMGLWSVSFIGPEVTLLEAGHTCFFEVYVEGPPTPLADGSRLFRALRGWQSDTEDWGREVTGHIQYKDLNGVDRKTTYKVGVDVLNRDCGVVVRLVTDQRN